jgi:hypothetical protein
MDILPGLSGILVKGVVIVGSMFGALVVAVAAWLIARRSFRLRGA